MRFWSTLKKKITNELRAWGGLLSPIVSTLSQGLRIIFERKTSLEQKARRLGEVWRGAGWENYRVDNIRHNFTASGTMLLLSLLVPPDLGCVLIRSCRAGPVLQMSFPVISPKIYFQLTGMHDAQITVTAIPDQIKG